LQGPAGSGTVPGANTQIIYNDGGAFGADNVFVWDETNNYMGIGTPTPAYPIDVAIDNGGGNVSIYASNDIIAFSDARVKTNIEIITEALNKVNSMRGVTFERTDIDSSDRFMGVIAQEVMKIVPEVVYQKKDGTFAVAYQNLIALLIEAIKDLSIKVDELEKIKPRE
jgi:hypothetical protein